jgi:hypothetical protein
LCNPLVEFYLISYFIHIVSHIQAEGFRAGSAKNNVCTKEGGNNRRLRRTARYNLYSSLVILRVMKCKREKGTGHLACTGEKINSCRVLVGDLNKETAWKMMAKVDMMLKLITRNVGC